MRPTRGRCFGRLTALRTRTKRQRFPCGPCGLTAHSQSRPFQPWAGRRTIRSKVEAGTARQPPTPAASMAEEATAMRGTEGKTRWSVLWVSSSPRRGEAMAAPRRRTSQWGCCSCAASRLARAARPCSSATSSAQRSTSCWRHARATSQQSWRWRRCACTAWGWTGRATWPVTCSWRQATSVRGRTSLWWPLRALREATRSEPPLLGRGAPPWDSTLQHGTWACSSTVPRSPTGKRSRRSITPPSAGVRSCQSPRCTLRWSWRTRHSAGSRAPLPLGSARRAASSRRRGRALQRGRTRTLQQGPRGGQTSSWLRVRPGSLPPCLARLSGRGRGWQPCWIDPLRQTFPLRARRPCQRRATLQARQAWGRRALRPRRRFRPRKCRHRPHAPKRRRCL
mmetsp:Transcript_24465/g.92408  ORF Transcript_24465/g.92408 Transcript_24465/m.92408 type:complete len:395 (+) Transcript_24465:1305-2489(+)